MSNPSRHCRRVRFEQLVADLMSRMPRANVVAIRDGLKTDLVTSVHNKFLKGFEERLHHIALCMPGADSVFHDLLMPPGFGGLVGTDRRKLRLFREICVYLSRLERKSSAHKPKKQKA